MNFPRYETEQISEHDWYIFDTNIRNLPVVYYLYFSHVRNGYYNYQVVLTRYDGIQAAFDEYPVFEKELFSTFLYVEPSLLNVVASSMLFLLQSMSIENPEPLCLYFGGMTNSNVVKLPKLPDYLIN